MNDFSLNDMVILNKDFSRRKKGERGKIIEVLNDNTYIVEFKDKDKYGKRVLNITSNSLKSANSKNSFSNKKTIKSTSFKSSSNYNNMSLIQSLINKLELLFKNKKIKGTWNYYGDMKTKFKIISSTIDSDFDIGLLYRIPSITPDTVSVLVLRNNNGIKCEIRLKNSFFK